MKKSLTWLGHGCWLVKLGEISIVFDPYLQTRTAPCGPDHVRANYVVLTHGHGDHCADALEIARKSNSTVVGIAEIAGWFSQKGIKKTEPMNIGGSIVLSESQEEDNETVLLTMTPALHSSTMPDGQSGGVPCGYLLSIIKRKKEELCKDLRPMSEMLKDAFVIYFAGDTGFFPGMKVFGDYGIDVAILPIGDRYTMGPALSLDAIKILQPKKVFPSHYGTWPPIEQNPSLWSDAVQKYTTAEPVVLRAGTETEI